MPRNNQQPNLTLSPTINERKLLAEIDLEVLGERIRRARLDKRFSQRDLVQDLFTSAYLSSVELGKTRPTPATLSRLATRLEKSIAYFVHPIGELGFPELNEEQDNVLQALFKLQTVQLGLARRDVPVAGEQLEEVRLHLGRLGPTERARYHYFEAIWFIQQQKYSQALTELTQASNILTSPGATTQLASATAATSGSSLELLILVEHAQGTAELGQRRRLAALSHYRRALELAIGDEGLEEPAPTEAESPTEAAEDAQSLPEFVTTHLLWQLHLSIANTYLALGEAQQALHFLEETLSQAENAGFGGIGNTDLRKQAAIWLQLAEGYQLQGDYTKASLYLGRSIQIYTQEVDRVELTRLHANLAQLQLRAGKHAVAEQTAQVALRLEQTTNLPSTSAQTTDTSIASAVPAQLTLANAYLKQGRLEEAVQLVQNILQLQVTEIGDTQTLLELYQIAAELAAAKGEQTSSASYYQKALKLVDPASDQTSPQTGRLSNTAKADLYYSYGQQLRKWGDTDRAFEYLDKALRLRQGSR